MTAEDRSGATAPQAVSGGGPARGAPRPATDEVDGELIAALARRHLSPLDVARAGVVSIDRAARLTRKAPEESGGKRHPGRRGEGAHGGAARPHGCEICRSPAVAEGLCDTCRKRLSLPLVDPDAGAQAAVRYRMDHPRGLNELPEAAGVRARPAAGEAASAPVPDVVVVGDVHRDETGPSAAEGTGRRRR